MRYGSASKDGTKVYIHFEVGGDEIPDGAIVTTWATIRDDTNYTKNQKLLPGFGV